MNERRPRALFIKLFSTAVINQALLSIGNLAIGLILIRNTSDLQYGYYVLVTNALMLMTALQGAYIGPPLVNRLARCANGTERGDLVGGLFREQRQLLRTLAAFVAAAGAVLWAAGVLNEHSGPVVIVAAAAAVATLNREFFRAALLAYHRPQDVLKADVVYVALLAAGALAATFTSFPAVLAVCTLGIGAVVGGNLARRALNRHERWNIRGLPGILRQIAPVGAWSTLGSAIHWAFNQGYSYLIAATLGVPAVAAIAATRLLMMPVNLLSNGLGSLLLPLAARWLHHHGPMSVLRRLVLVTFGLAGAALAYFALMWVLRDWIFDSILHKHFEQRDLLLGLWVVVFLLIVFRDQLIWLLVARERFRPLAGLTAFSAVIALTASYFAMHRIGAPGALVGIAFGESLQVLGIIVMSLREPNRIAAAPASAPASASASA
ncbi:MAG TPA: capsular biosynthesis protein [Burkholderiaceae bacterium]|nr:capsular biosynthesis protein [Burkholderiaceae bacterium]